MELWLIGALVVLAIVLVLITVPLVQRQRRSGSVRAVMPGSSSQGSSQDTSRDEDEDRGRDKGGSAE